MTPTEYIKNAQATSAGISPEIVTRLCEPKLLSYFLSRAGRVTVMIEELDDIKKHVFYGKPITINSSLPDPLYLEQMQKILCNEKQIRLFHGILGKITEAGELLHQLSESLAGIQPIDEVNVIEEMGDDSWYDAEVLTALGVTYEQIWDLNIKKLKARYPQKFTEEAALNRDLVNERTVLEGGEPPSSAPFAFGPHKAKECTCGVQLTEIDSNCPQHGHMR
jgi:hypothetical protein